MPQDPVINSEIFVKSSEGNSLELNISGRLDFSTVEKFWDKTRNLINKNRPELVYVECSKVSYCDTLGVVYFIKLRELSKKNNFQFKINNLSGEFQKLINLFDSYSPEQKIEIQKSGNFVVELGKEAVEEYETTLEGISFIGEVTVGFLRYFANPAKIRWNDILITADKLGVNAFWIIALVNFLVGLVIAFQSAIPLSQYGGTIFVADLLVLSVFKELGPLMTAIVVNGRSSSAFAAEIGTMKVNEEVDALTTMGVDRIRFLVMPKFIATVLMLPILTVFGILFALLGGLVVFITLGFPPITYLNQLTSAANYVDLLAGLFKTIFFALIIAGVGCLEGLRTKSGASAVGDSTTQAVVKGIILIVVVDGIFGVVYYYLGI
ncbi:MAG: ABC transporter permease [Thermodesulfobacteriota bacterium]